MAAASTSSRVAAAGRPRGRTVGTVVITTGTVQVVEAPDGCHLIHARRVVNIHASRRAGNRALNRRLVAFIRVGVAFAAASGLALAVAVPAGALDPGVEAQNYNKGQERQTIYDTPQYQTRLFQVSQQ